MRYPASEKLEIIRIVEQSHLPAKRTLDQLGIARRTFYRWYDRFLEGGPEALEDRPSTPGRVWNRIAPEVQDQIVEWRLNSPSYHRANWRCDLPMNANTLCPKPRFTACSRPMI
jgi:transposase-like protein